MTRRSIHDYTKHPVPEELIKILVEAGMCAPSAFNERSQENRKPKKIALNRPGCVKIAGNQDLLFLRLFPLLRKENNDVHVGGGVRIWGP